jgi:hypothetical protein
MSEITLFNIIPEQIKALTSSKFVRSALRD